MLPTREADAVGQRMRLLIGRDFKWKNRMSIHLERKDLLNTQQMEVAVNGPDGATHLILCTGVAILVDCQG